MKHLFRLILLALLVVGCDSGGDEDFVVVGNNGNNPAQTANLQFNFVLARAIPAAVDQIRLTGFSAQQAVTFGPQTFAKAPQITITVPISTVLVRGEYLDNGVVIGIFELATTGLVAGETEIINDPNFTDVEQPVEPSPVLSLGLEGLDQGNPEIAMTDDGFLAMVYNQGPDPFEAGPRETLVRTFSISSFSAVPSSTSTNQLLASRVDGHLAMENDGDFFVGYQVPIEDENPLPAGSELFARRYNRSGNSASAAGAAVSLFTGAANLVGNPQLDVPGDNSSLRAGYWLLGDEQIAYNAFNLQTLAPLGPQTVITGSADFDEVSDVAVTPDGDYNFLLTNCDFPAGPASAIVVVDRNGNQVAGPLSLGALGSESLCVFAADNQGVYRGVATVSNANSELDATTFSFDPEGELAIDLPITSLGTGVALFPRGPRNISVIPGTNRFVMSWAYRIPDVAQHIRLRSYNGLTLAPVSDTMEVSLNSGETTNGSPFTAADSAGNVAVVWVGNVEPNNEINLRLFPASLGF
jgi:hypothetical protein